MSKLYQNNSKTSMAIPHLFCMDEIHVLQRICLQVFKNIALLLHFRCEPPTQWNRPQAPIPLTVPFEIQWDVVLVLSVIRRSFLAATKQLYECFSLSVRLSVRLSICLSHLFNHVPIIVSSWNFQELLPTTEMLPMQKVKVRGQRSRSQRSKPNLVVS